MITILVTDVSDSVTHVAAEEETGHRFSTDKPVRSEKTAVELGQNTAMKRMDTPLQESIHIFGQLRSSCSKNSCLLTLLGHFTWRMDQNTSEDLVRCLCLRFFLYLN